MKANEALSYIRARGGLTRLELAQLAGVAPSTITRIEDGSSEPSWKVMSSILTAAGYQVLDGLKPSGDLDAVRAARVALGELDPNDTNSGTQAWLTRWNRARLIDGNYRVQNVDKLVAQAGIAAPLMSRPGRRIAVKYDKPWQETAARLSQLNRRYAVTGITATSKTRLQDGSAWPVMYVDDPEGVVQELGLTPAKRGALLTLLPFNTLAETGTVTEDGVTWVSPAQALIDSYSGPGRMADQAESAAARWQQRLANA
ncbi:helix-turn-helix transcriptional regulator [Agreia sp. PsM10]|uniref:helix-turn-helix transcriptional regulator n=1 Tax=Agreia sp. PsM10 TaxID=3030533 RepID=UPI00263A9D52|nr:helix-turn-helix transcriptional regulator [Agreia sp. PsM10]MDN4639428.1 helix-turn-helix transcriptional regulator [Agreia sp. PsM10]